MTGRRVLSVLALGLGMTAALLWVLTRMPVEVQADSTTLYVSGKGGSDGGILDPNNCTNVYKPCKTIQHAVDEATRGGRIFVTGGTYSDVHEREGVTQVVYLHRSVTIRGGYDFDFSEWDPARHATILNAEEQGRVVYITEGVTPTLEALSLTDGKVTASGGGLYAASSSPRIDGCRIYSNTAGWYGGGVFLNETAGAVLRDSAIHDNRADAAGGGVSISYGTDVTLTDNDVHENHAHSGDGGGVQIRHVPSATLTDNSVSSNTAGGYGGGVYIYDSDHMVLEDNVICANACGWSGGGLSTGSIVTLIGNEIYSNTADGAGGGVDLRGNDHATLVDNEIYSNTASSGGGVNTFNSPGIALVDNAIHHNTATTSSGGGIRATFTRLTVTRDAILNNTSTDGGGGLFTYGSALGLVNSIVAGNQITGTGAGIWAADTRVTLLHTTLACNEGGDGSGIWLKWSSVVSSMNTILVGHTLGITAAEGTTVTTEATLWGSGAWANGTDWTGQGAVATGTVNVWGDPLFVDPASGDYHIGPGAAAGAGVDAGVTEDIDGDSRPAPTGTNPDIGADEVAQCRVALPLVLRDL